MKKLIPLILIVGLMGCRGTGTSDEKVELKTSQDKVSYCIGTDIGRNFKTQGMDVNPSAVARGIRDALNENEFAMTDEEMRSTMQAFQVELKDKHGKAMKEASEKNRKEGEIFLAENAKKEGVVTLESGLQYKIIKPGTGRTPKLSDTVVTHYKGRLINGKVFDSSYDRGEPVSFPVSGVISGWTEALQLMKEGAKWELYIQSALAYGPRGAGPDIGPDATLIFEIELVSIK